MPQAAKPAHKPIETPEDIEAAIKSIKTRGWEFKMEILRAIAATSKYATANNDPTLVSKLWEALPDLRPESEELLKLSGTLRSEKGAALRRLSPAEKRLSHDLGTPVPEEGIYFGIGYLWSNPKYKQKHMKGPVLLFDMYAAPENLTDKNGQPFKGTLAEAFKRIAHLKGFHGHDGFRRPAPEFQRPDDYSYSDGSFREFVLEGKYNGEWVVPPTEVIEGSLSDALIGPAERTQDYPLLKTIKLKESWTCSITSTARMLEQHEYVALREGRITSGSSDDKLETRPVRFVRRSGPEASQR